MGNGYGGTGIKAPNDLVIPLCRTHHTEFHNMGYKAWEYTYGHQVDGVRRIRSILAQILTKEWKDFYMKHHNFVPEMRVIE